MAINISDLPPKYPKNSVKIIGDHTDKYVQAYFQYDSKKTEDISAAIHA